jgi:hypothetical protein
LTAGTPLQTEVRRPDITPMKLILVVIALSVLVGWLAGGRLSRLSRLRLRWAGIAIIGLALQLAPVPSRGWAMGMLFVSFGLLVAFAIVNVRIVGFPLVLIGIVLNLTVIAVNRGMPVTEQALVASGQQDTLRSLIKDGGAKHHLAGPDDSLLFLGDVIAIGDPVSQAISLGDIFTFGGVMCVVIGGMLGRSTLRRRPTDAAGRSVDAMSAGAVADGDG